MGVSRASGQQWLRRFPEEGRILARCRMPEWAWLTAAAAISTRPPAAHPALTRVNLAKHHG